MKIVKLIIGMLILYGSGTEYISASKQLSTYFDPGIIIGCLIVLLLSGWLIGSGLSNNKFEIRSFQFVKYFLLSVLGFIAFAFFALLNFKPDTEIIKVNGLNVNIAEFMDGSRNIIPDETERRTYCTCVVNKLAGNANVRDNFSAELQNGSIDKIMISIKSDPDFYKLKLNECMSSVKNLHWTDTFEKSARKSLYEQVKNSELSKTNNIDIYCDCLIEEYKKLPVSEITDPEFYQSQNSIYIDSLCNLKSKN
ncbi:MAG: hypothetical protein ABIO79_13485 [Ferruginibacter sp.]